MKHQSSRRRWPGHPECSLIIVRAEIAAGTEAGRVGCGGSFLGVVGLRWSRAAPNGTVEDSTGTGDGMRFDRLIWVSVAFALSSCSLDWTRHNLPGDAGRDGAGSEACGQEGQLGCDGRASKSKLRCSRASGCRMALVTRTSAATAVTASPLRAGVWPPTPNAWPMRITCAARVLH